MSATAGHAEQLQEFLEGALADLRVIAREELFLPRAVRSQQRIPDQPALVLERNAQGWNVGRLVREQRREAEREGPARPLSLRSIEVTDASVSISDGAVGTSGYRLPGRITDLDIKAGKLSALVDEVEGRIGTLRTDPHHLVLGECSGEAGDRDDCRGGCKSYKSPGDTHFHFLPVRILFLTRWRFERAPWLGCDGRLVSLGRRGKESNDRNLCLRILKPKRRAPS